MKIHRSLDTLRLIHIVSDGIILALIWTSSFQIRFESGLIDLPRGPDSLDRYLILGVPLIIIHYFIFFLLGIYQNNHSSSWTHVGRIIKAHGISFLLFITSVFFLFEHRYSRVTLFIYVFLSSLILPISYIVLKKAFKNLLNFKAIAVVSTEALEKFKKIEYLLRKLWFLKITNIYHPEDLQTKDLQSSNMVIFCLNSKDTSLLSRIPTLLSNTLGDIFIVPYFQELPSSLSPKVFHLQNEPLLLINASGLSGIYHIFKRIFDIIFSLTFIILFSPVYLIISILILITSPGPIFYRQERMGLDGKTFECLKFRGMHINAETETGPVWAKAQDDRTTKLGKWLRKTSLDEIPQFINVLKGDMSVVGPRPERPYFVDHFRHQIPGYMLRHKVKSGITGWAQIHGWRGNTSLEKRIEYDLWYIQNWSLWLDLKICVLTPFKGLINEHAY